MAKPAAKLITWIALAQARAHVAKVYLSQKYAEQWIMERLAAGDLIWRARAVHPPGHPTKEFWQRLSTVEWDENSARQVIGPIDVPDVMGLAYLVLIGIEVALEGLPSGDGQPKRSLSPEEWLYRYFDNHPRPNADMETYAAIAAECMKQADDVTGAVGVKRITNLFYRWRKGK